MRCCPWYAIQDTAWYSVLPQIFGGAETANGMVQALVHGRKWLLLGLMGCCGYGGPACHRAATGTGCWQVVCWVFWAAGQRFHDWRAWLVVCRAEQQFGELTVNQFGIGMGGFHRLAVTGHAHCVWHGAPGFFKGDLFVASSVWAVRCCFCCSLPSR
jgi:iron(III) transport system permease protein